MDRGCEERLRTGCGQRSIVRHQNRNIGVRRRGATFCLLGVGCSAISVLPLHAHSVAAADLPYQVCTSTRNIVLGVHYKTNRVWKREDRGMKCTEVPCTLFLIKRKISIYF